LITRIAWRSIRSRPMAAAVSILGLAVGVAGVRAMTLGADGAIATLSAAFDAAAGPAEWVVLPMGDARTPLAPAIAERLAAVPGVTLLPLVVAPTLRPEDARLWMGVVLPEGDAGLTMLGVDPRSEANSPRWRVVSGESTVRCGPAEPDGAAAGDPRRPEPEPPAIHSDTPAIHSDTPPTHADTSPDVSPCPLDGAHVLVGDAWARSRSLKPGDSLRVVAGTRIFEARIAGTIAREGLGARGYGRVVIAPIDAVRGAFAVAPGASHELGIVLAEPPSSPPPELVAAAGPGAALVRPADRADEIAQKLANMRAGTDLLSAITLLLAALLLSGQLAARAAERTRTLGLLRAVGATRTQAAATLLTEALILAVPGAALGVALGHPFASGVAFALGQAAQADLQVGVWDLGGAVLAFVLGLTAALAAAALPARRAALADPLDNLRARSGAAEPAPGGLALIAALVLLVSATSLALDSARDADRIWTLARVIAALGSAAALLPTLMPPWAGLLRRATRNPATALGVASLRWRPLRAGLAAGTVLVGVALAGGVGAIGRGLEAELDRWSSRALGWDLYVSRPDGFTDAELDAVRDFPGVQQATGVSIRPVIVRFGEHPLPVALVALDPAAYAGADLLDVVTPDGSPAADGPQIVSSLADDRGVLVTTVLAEQLALAPGDLVTLPNAGPLPVRGLVVDYTQNGFAVIVSQSLLRATQGADKLDLLAVNGDARAALEAMPGVVVESRGELRGRILRLVRASIAALDVLLWLAGAVGVLAVGATLAQSAVERRGDLAVLRAVGLARRDVPRMLVAEGVATAGIGVLGGIPVGVALGKVLTDATHTLGIPVPYAPAWGPLFGASIAALLAGALAAWLPARRAAAVEPMDALRE
jgi:putative ABC transport system permease protein